VLQAQPDIDLLTKANQLYDAGKKEEAKTAYQKAAAGGNADAHFALAYKYVLNDEERTLHFKEAALGGHAEAMDYFLEAVFFRANDLRKANPFLGMEVYQQAKKEHPQMAFFDEQGEVDVLKKAMEAGPFDADVFIKKYHIDTTLLEEPYGIWQLAGEASKGGRFGKPDLRLVLQLVSRGGSVPRELAYAIDTAYDCWKNNRPFIFVPCDYVTSGMGMGICANQYAKERDKALRAQLKALAPKLKNNAGQYIMPAYNAASEFIGSKAWKEELHGGSGYAAWAWGSVTDQRQAFVDLVLKLSKGKTPNLKSGAHPDATLNATYQKLIRQLKIKPLDNAGTKADADGLRITQRLWLAYRDAFVKLASSMVPQVSQQQWLNWITEERIKNFNELLEMAKEEE
jgi:uncharacterized protein YecT (DUF1311 family)